jgi:hypothetical protein
MTDLNKLTKKQLEEIGREHGVELDRRLTKKKLVEAIEKLLDEPKTLVDLKAEVVEEESNVIEGWCYETNGWDRNTKVGRKKYFEEFKKRH